jgi:hypothetical protein
VADRTGFSELDDVLADLSRSARAALGETYVGTYLQGSFALGAGDAQSDADFIVVTTVLPSGQREAELRALHAAIPSRPGVWNINLEGSYADLRSLRSVDGLGVPWLFVNRGHREMVWDAHCNTLHTRWIMRNHGMVIDGPPAASLIDEVPAALLRASAAETLPGLLDDIAAWADMDNAWTQKYIVETYSRVLHTALTGRVISKAGGLRWALDTLGEEWGPLLRQVAADRSAAWKPVDPPRPGSMEQARSFAAFVEQLPLPAATGE